MEVESPEKVEKMEERLKETIRKRVEEARILNIYGMAALVAEELGVRFGKNYGSYYVFPKMSREEFNKGKERRVPLGIVYDDYGSNLTIFYRGKEVFDVHLGDIELYNPEGNWVNELVKLYETAKLSRAKKEVAREIKKIKEEAEKWGVSIEALMEDEE